MSSHLIIDGYNAINKIEALKAQRDLSLEAARLFFIKMLKDFMAEKHVFNKISIVFDSKEKALGVRKVSYGDVEAIFATHNKDADSVIVDMLKKAPSKDKIAVSSDDNFIRNHARAFGKDILSIKELEKIIMLKKGALRSKIKGKDLRNTKIKEINEELKKHWGLK